ncbi:hypothetical protein BJ684DRAFT_20859 [Piptocephalis cylindrospora]|uniref:Ricin B lectin domain-containing protein n=1 Tax=Piptocephalis cylindrospora TaxID=1907219 RepID=A0A4P9Y1H3_9FUNG|nr:hypothetical protein BJ684DRAFT_20859 [Piptocephalis cylindrospora]|eukprot:RKP12613.1 hypothetical protein BJ684DRAFT_20859 [Piptocephalis cylindrospora]
MQITQITLLAVFCLLSAVQVSASPKKYNYKGHHNPCESSHPGGPDHEGYTGYPGHEGYPDHGEYPDNGEYPDYGEYPNITGHEGYPDRPGHGGYHDKPGHGGYHGKPGHGGYHGKPGHGGYPGDTESVIDTEYLTGTDYQTEYPTRSEKPTDSEYHTESEKPTDSEYPTESEKPTDTEEPPTETGTPQKAIHLKSSVGNFVMTNSSTPNDFQMFLSSSRNVVRSNAVNFLLDAKKPPSLTQETGVYVIMPESEASCLTRKPANAARGLWVGNVPCVPDPTWNPPNQQWYIRQRRVGYRQGWTFASAMLDGDTCIAPAHPYNATYSYIEIPCDDNRAIWIEA